MTAKRDQARPPGPEQSKRVLLGVITSPHGIRGEVHVKSFAAEPGDVAAYGPLSNAAGDRTFALKVVRVSPKGTVIVRVAGVGDRNAAEALAGTELFIERSRLSPADEGEFYHADLIGMDAVSRDGAMLGTVIAVHNFGAGDIIELSLVGKSVTATELVPFDDVFVPSVDLTARRVTVVLPDATEDDQPIGQT